MSFPFFIYLLVGGINGVLLSLNGFGLSDWQWWAWMTIPIVTWLCGREYESKK